MVVRQLMIVMMHPQVLFFYPKFRLIVDLGEREIQNKKKFVIKAICMSELCMCRKESISSFHLNYNLTI